MNIFFHVLGEADKRYTCLTHKILTERKAINRIAFFCQMTGAAQGSMKYLMKYFHLNSNLKDRKLLTSLPKLENL